MSIEESNKIDIIATRPESDVVRLVITDHLDWSDFDRHALLLQEKVNTYIAFVESGQLQRVERPKIPPNPQVVIAIAMKEEPTQAAELFFTKVEEFLKGVGLRFELDRRHAGE